MALQKTITLIDNFGESITFRNAYIRVDALNGGKEGFDIMVGIYKLAGGKLITTSRVPFTASIDGNNFIAQAYEHLKTLPEFSNAQDC